MRVARLPRLSAVPDASAIRRLTALSLGLLVLRIATAALLPEPGYTDSYYFTAVADRLAHGAGLTADFLWSPLEAPSSPAALTLPVASHVFWVPLPTAVAALAIAVIGPLAGAYRAAQTAFVVLAAFIPAAAYVAARSLGATDRSSLLAATLAGLGTITAPFLSSVDAFAPAALLGTAFFMTYAHASRGSMRASAAAGALVGLLYLTRSEAALFGVALVALVFTAHSRAAGVVGALVALAIGSAWFARDLSVGLHADLFARSALLVRYEDFFAYAPEYAGTLSADAGAFLVPKAGALLTNLIIFAFAVAIVPLAPLAVGVRALRARADVRAWVALAVTVYLAQSLIFTLHSTRGSYLHSLAAFLPYGVAIAAVGADRLLAGLARSVASAWAAGALLLAGLLSIGAIVQIDGGLASGAVDRAAALDAIPAGPFLAIDAAAWRWAAGRSVAVAPADGIAYAACVAVRTNARSLVLDGAHFHRYDALYDGTERWSWLGAPIARGAIKIFPIVGEPQCAGR